MPSGNALCEILLWTRAFCFLIATNSRKVLDIYGAETVSIGSFPSMMIHAEVNTFFKIFKTTNENDYALAA